MTNDFISTTERQGSFGHVAFPNVAVHKLCEAWLQIARRILNEELMNF